MTTKHSPESKQFIDKKEHDLIIGQIKDFGDVDEPDNPLSLLNKYFDLLRLRDGAFPLLLGNGDPLMLERVPTHLYLLPEFKPLGENVRWVLVQYPSVRNHLPLMELLQWRFPPDERAEIIAFGDPRRVETGSDKIYSDFTRRALNIRSLIDEDQLTLTLQFEHGQLKINASSDSGIDSLHWTERFPQHPGRRLERASFSEKPALLWVGENDGVDNWYRDNLYDNQQPIQLPGTIGKIFGMDAAQANPNLIYFGDSSSSIHRIDIASPDKQLLTSKSLGSGIYDVLIVPHPDGKTAQTMLAATDSGHIFCLEDKDDQLSILHYQATGEHFKQLLGCGGSDILAVDHYNNLIPLKLVSPVDFISLQTKLTNSLFNHPRITELFSIDLALHLKNEGQAEQAHCLARLAMEYYILHSRDEEYDATILNAWFRWLNQSNMAQGINYWRWLELHLSLLERLENWLKQACYCSVVQQWPKIPACDVHRLEPLWIMYGPDEKDEKDIPDEVWSKILQGSHLIATFLRINGLDKKPEFHRRWLAIAQRLAHIRECFRPYKLVQRPLAILDSTRAERHFTELQLITEDHSFYHMAAIDCLGVLHIVAVPKQAPLLWTIAPFPANCPPWQGRPITLLAGTNLQGLLGGSAQQWIFVATDRGEMALFEWKVQPTGRGQIEQRCRKNFPLFARHALAINWKNSSGKAIILTGRDHKHLSVIARLRFSRPKQGIIDFDCKILWQDDSRGEVRKPVLSSYGNKLWVINQRRRSALVCWNIGFERNELVLEKEKQPWLLSDQPLHCLKLGGPNRDILVCGGHDGLVYALDAGDGKLLWLVNCGKSLRRLCYMPSQKKSGLWLLGSDHPNLVFVDDGGRFLAIYEKAGPVTALCQLSAQRLLLCNASGRLLLMDSERPDNTGALVATTENQQLLAGFYPRRMATWISSDVLQQTLQEQLKQQVAIGRDFLAMQVWFQSALECLRQDSGWLAKADNPFDEYLVQQLPQRIGLFLSDLRHLPDAMAHNTYPGLTQLLTEIWQSLSERHNDVLIPQLIHHLLRTLETQRHADRAEPEAQQLFEDINRFLWRTVDHCDEQLTEEAEEDRRPHLRASHLRDLRLSQTVYFWQKTDKDAPVYRRLEEWCAALHIAWGLLDEQALKRRLHWVLDDAALHLVSGDNRQWQDWLTAIVAEEDTAPESLPIPLQPLLQNAYSPWTEAQKNALVQLWATGHHDFWQIWVEKTQALLEKLEESSNETKRVIWQELSLINQIRGVFRDQGAMWFSFQNGYHLLALCWPAISADWEAKGKEQVDGLLEKAAQDPKQYVDLKQQKVHWRTGSHAMVTLELTNRHPDILRPELERISMSGANIGDMKLPEQFDAKPEATLLEIEIITPTPGILHGTLSLGLHSPHRGDNFIYSVQLEDKQSIEAFNDSPGFRETWKRLQTLLTQQTYDKPPAFVWRDGGYWPDDERERLKALVREKFPAASIEYSAIFEQAPDKPSFSPDIALGSVSEGALLEQVHGLLHALEETGLNRAAWSVWLYYRDAAPDSVERALNDWLYSREYLDTVLQTVLDAEHLQIFSSAVNSLDKRAMGAWCYGQPLYAEDTSEVANVAMEERYVAAESLFGLDIWQALNKQGVTQAELAGWLGIGSELAGDLLRIGVGLAGLQYRGQDSAAFEPAAKHFSAVLGGNLGVSANTQQLYYAEFAKKEDGISVLHGTLYQRCYLFFADGLELGEIAAIGEQHEQGLWLCVVSGNAPAGLPGETLSLSAQQLCSVLFAGNRQQAFNALNQLAALQLDYDPGTVFRIAGGQSREQTERHFSGREKELQNLHKMLAAADRGELSTRLIIGTRRLGKTSLWDHFRYEVNVEQPNRPFIYLDLHDFKVGDTWSPVRIEREFIARLYQVAGWGDIQHDWPSGLRDDTQKSLDVGNLLKTRLAKYKPKAVLILDETRNWAEIDYNIGHRMLSTLRSLTDGGNCALVATSYPFHPNQHWGLNLAQFQANTGAYNYFQDDINLSPWPKATAWRYLQDKLAGFGIVLPYQYRREMWTLTRGIPWIAHQLGRELCDLKISTAHSRRSVVLRSEWRSAYRKTLTKIYAELRATVTAVVEDLSKTYRPLGRSAAKELRHQDLWRALSELAQNPLFNDSEEQGADELFFSFNAIAEKLPDADQTALRRVLNALTATPVLCAYPEREGYDEQPYWFANNLFPSCLFLIRQNYPVQAEGGEV